jgi:hypothetical protein
VIRRFYRERIAMKNRYAIASRVFQFRSGHGKFCFHACAEHAPKLQTSPDVNFMEIPSRPIVDEDPADEIECDLCEREPADDGEAFRGGEAAAYEREDMARIQRDLK